MRRRLSSRALAMLAFLLLAGCSFRGGDHSPLAKEPDTPCSLEAEAFCEEHLGAADLATCIKREKYRCEVREEVEQSEPR